ncbi:gliding motility-associated C-terminal domain-containing protein [Confluentibacter sediminis]|uniref:T9SS type B sorting domain-containing protein n=1 Tax=Confluentibacter sediminis TaxID=2219045 RepID=UPI000DAC4D30|nr:gliding motility-associated C-terminal domain-containing protein [Confluentibacter sediminis]
MRNFTIIILIFSFTKAIHAQIFIASPNLGFTQACASSSTSFNAFTVTFSFTPSTGLAPTNQFIIELSDASGSFTNSTIVFTSAQGAVTTSPATLSFSLPTTTSGEAYRVRIKSTAPASESQASNAFAAYYKIQDSPFSINNLIETGVYCAGGSYLLTIDNPGFGSNDSPLQYPSLTFNWYRETSPTTSVFVGSGNTFYVNTPGTYFAETNYGTCTSNSFSNRVTISEATSGGVSSNISSSLGNPYCVNEGPTTLTTIHGNGYQWFKDGSAISGATNQTYVTNESGSYSVSIDLGECVSTASIDLDTSTFTSSIDVEENNILNEDETLLATVTTDATNPEFEWYLNDVIISGETGNSYEVTQEGNYKVIIYQTSGCIASKELVFNVTEAFPDVAHIPNLISPNADGINDTWVIPQKYVAGTNTEVIIMSSQGKIVLKTDDYQNNWPQDQIDFKDTNPVYYYIITTQDNQIKKGSITVVK